MPGNRQPIVVLVRPQLPENVGMCARAMLNCGLERLRLVSPRDGWRIDEARPAAADADRVLDRASVFASLDEALADCRRVYATTARDRSGTQPVLEAECAAAEIASSSVAGETAVLFGAEASGLDAGEVARADSLVRFRTNPDFPSLNLAQAVLLFGWEWSRNQERSVAENSVLSPARRSETDVFLARLNEALGDRGFFLTEELRPHTERRLRTFFAKAMPTEDETKLLHGALTALLREAGNKT